MVRYMLDDFAFFRLQNAAESGRSETNASGTNEHASLIPSNAKEGWAASVAEYKHDAFPHSRIAGLLKFLTPSYVPSGATKWHVVD